jgi:hypothetical protein
MFARSVLALLFVFGSAFGLAAQPRAPGLEDVIRQFDAVAFGHEHGPSRQIVQKWTESPGLALFSDEQWDARPYLGAIEAHLGAIRSLTGIAVAPERRGAQTAAFRIGFYPRVAFAQMPRVGAEEEHRRWVATSACLALAVQDPRRAGRIVAAAIAIGTDIPEGQRRHCLLEELVQAMGLPNDACHYRPSLFCEEDRVLELAPADRLLLKALYDPRLEAGMSRVEALPIIRRIVTELMGEPENP